MPVDSERIAAIAKRINETSSADFVKRLLDKRGKVLKNEDGTVSTHELGYVEEGDHAVVFPGVQSDGDSLRRYHYPESYRRAVRRGDTVHMSVPEAEAFTRNYKEVYPGFNRYDGRGKSFLRRAFDFMANVSQQASENARDVRTATASSTVKDMVDRGDEEAAQKFAKDYLAADALGIALGAAGAVSSASLESGMQYLQPSKYIDWAVRGFKPASAMLKTAPYYTGATTLGGVMADTLADSYFATQAARNMGKTGSVSGEIVNAIDFLPLAGPLAGAYRFGAQAWPTVKDWGRMVIGGDFSKLDQMETRAGQLLREHVNFSQAAKSRINEANVGKDFVRVEVPVHNEMETVPLAGNKEAVQVGIATATDVPFRYDDIDTTVPYVSEDIGTPGEKAVVLGRRRLGVDPTGDTDDVLSVKVTGDSNWKTDPYYDYDSDARRWSRRLLDNNILPWSISRTPVNELTVRGKSKLALRDTAVETTTGGASLDILSPQAAAKSKPIKDYMDGVNTTLGDDGIIAGSTTLHAKGYLSGTPHDTEVITTRSRLPEVERKLGVTVDPSKTTDIKETGVAAKGFNGGDIDIQIIDENAAGEATGRLAWSMYRTMNPADFQRQAEASVLSATNYTDRVIINPKTGLPFTADELLRDFRAGNYSEQNTIVDALSVMKDLRSTNIHKHNRPVSLLTNTDPEAVSAVSDAISTIGVSQIGSGFRKGSDYFPALSFDDVEDNRKFLKTLGIQKDEVAENPEVMRNLFDYWYMQQSIQKRGVKDVGTDLGKARQWALESNFQRGGGDASGAGRNTVMATTSRMPFSHPYVGASQTHLTNPENAGFITSINDVVDMAERLKNTSKLEPSDIKTARKVFEGKHQGQLSDPDVKSALDTFWQDMESTSNPTVDTFQSDVSYIASILSSKGVKETDIESAIDGLSEAFGIPFFRNTGSWYEGKYIGVLRKDSDAGGVRYFDFGLYPNPEVRPYEFGRDIEGYANRFDSSIGYGPRRRLSKEELSDYFPQEELDKIDEFNARMHGDSGAPVTVGELQQMSPDVKVTDEREDFRNMLYDWLDNTHEYEETMDKIDRMRAMPGVNARQKLNQAVSDARQARVDRQISKETEQISNFTELSRNERTRIARKAFNSAGEHTEAGLSRKFSDYRIVGSRTDGTGLQLMDKNTGEVADLRRNQQNEWVLEKSGFSIPQDPKGVRLRAYSSYVKDALKNTNVPTGFDAKNITYAEKMPDGTIRLHYRGSGYDVLEQIDGKWQFQDLPFAFGGKLSFLFDDGRTLLHDYNTGGKIHIKPENRGNLFFEGGFPSVINPRVLHYVIKRGIGKIKEPILRAIPEDVLIRTANALQFSDNRNHPSRIISDALDSNLQPVVDSPGSVHLLDAKRQRERLEDIGYKLVEDEDYGPVSSAVENTSKRIGRSVPIYQIGEDEVAPERVSPIVTKSGESYVMDFDGGIPQLLRHAGSYPTSFYKDNQTGDIYFRSYDLNDYGGNSSLSKSHPYVEEDEDGMLRVYGDSPTTYGLLQPLADLYDFIGNPIVQRTGLMKAPDDVVHRYFGDEYRNGGRIHIKPENRGKFTALKKRTGHSASWFKAHGTPAQKKMAVFALNARKWKHGDGGLISRMQAVYGEDTEAMLKAVQLVKKNKSV